VVGTQGAVEMEQDYFIGKVKLRYWRMTHKFGIHLPHSIQETLKINEKNWH
jgi:hypothetical protein